MSTPFSLDADAALRGASEGALSAPPSNFAEQLVMGLDDLAHQQSVIHHQIADAFLPWTVEALNVLDVIRDGSPATSFQAYFSHKVYAAPVPTPEPVAPPCPPQAVPTPAPRRRFWQRFIAYFRRDS